MHVLNFFNPRLKEEVMGDLGKLYEGISKMNFDKMKEALVYASKEQTASLEKDRREIHKLLANKKGGKVSMKGRTGGMGGAGSEIPGDLRSIQGFGMGVGGGGLPKTDLDDFLKTGEDTLGDISFSNYTDTKGQYDYLLDNDLLS
jgi:hypothetical protein